MPKQVVPTIVAINLPNELKNIDPAELENIIRNIQCLEPKKRIKAAIKLGLGQDKVSLIITLLKDKKNTDFERTFREQIKQLEKIDNPNEQVAEAMVLGITLAKTIRSASLTDENDYTQHTYQP